MTDPRPRRRLAAVAAGVAVAILTASAPGVSAATKTTKKATTKTTKKSTTKTTKKSTTKTTKKKSVKSVSMRKPNGRPPNPAAPFLWNTTSNDPALPGVSSFEAATTQLVPSKRLFTLLIIGSDARANEKMDRTRGDSIHLFVWNPAWNKGTIIGFPRDSYVDVPGKGKQKITSALALGGPQLMMDTVNLLTKGRLPVSRWVVTGFSGFTNMINDIGGVNVLVDPAMNDSFSGAKFQKGWFAMNGAAALAFSRNRHSVAGGDFGRSLNQGKFLIYTLAKLREEVSDVPGLLKWINSFRKNGKTNIPVGDMLVMAQMVRGMEPREIRNVVVSGKSQKVKGADVVVLDQRMYGLFQDVANDGVADGK